jgi:hypothetical protein
MIQPCLGRISQVYPEEPNDEGAIVRSTRSAREKVILQLDAGVGFAIIHDDVA